jgi:uncharacterized damage-inducible protein DinB
MAAKNVELGVLAAYVDGETGRWRGWFDTAPAEVLDLPLGPGAEGTIRTLIKHIFAVELRYAQRLVGDPVTGYEQLADGTVQELWRIHRTATSIRDRFLREATCESLHRVLVSETRKLGRIESPAHVVVMHTFIHGIRHWAQIAAVLRQHGHGGLWEHDWLLSPEVQSPGQSADQP